MNDNVIEFDELVDEGESCALDGQFIDLENQTLNAAAIQTWTLSLQNESDGQVINSRLEQNVKDINGGTLDPSGTWTIHLSKDDSPIVSAVCGDNEPHLATVKWTWIDSDGITHSGTQKYRLTISPILAPCGAGGWIG